MALLAAGQSATVDGGEGIVYARSLPVEQPREQDDVHLTRLVEWARQRCPVRVLRPAEATEAAAGASADGGAAARDVDAALAAAGADAEPALFAGMQTVTGSALATPACAVLAVRGGVGTIVTEPVLPALLAILRMPR